ncbi:MAG TPA: hypothetical protein VIH49_06890, partial [Solirubrobacteraceae bacterium]
ELGIDLSPGSLRPVPVPAEDEELEETAEVGDEDEELVLTGDQVLDDLGLPSPLDDVGALEEVDVVDVDVDD